MHLAWPVLLFGLVVSGIPLDSNGNGNGNVQQDDAQDSFEACEQAFNCEIIIDEDGDRTIDFRAGMGPGSEIYRKIQLIASGHDADLLDDPALFNGTTLPEDLKQTLESRSKPVSAMKALFNPVSAMGPLGASLAKWAGSHTSDRNSIIRTHGGIGNKKVEWGCSDHVNPADRVGRALEDRCPGSLGSCLPGPYTQPIHYVESTSGLAPGSGPTEWKLKANGKYDPGHEVLYIDALKALAKHTAKSHKQEWRDPPSRFEWKAGECTLWEGSNWYHVGRWVRYKKGLPRAYAGGMSAKVSLPQLGGNGFCSNLWWANAGATYGALVPVVGPVISAFFGTFNVVCSA